MYHIISFKARGDPLGAFTPEGKSLEIDTVTQNSLYAIEKL